MKRIYLPQKNTKNAKETAVKILSEMRLAWFGISSGVFPDFVREGSDIIEQDGEVMNIQNSVFLSVVLITCAMGYSADAEKPLGKSPVLFSCDFESSTWFSEWGLKKAPSRVEMVESAPALKFEPLSGKAMQIKVDKDGHYGLSLEYPFKKLQGEEPEEIYFRYYIRLADDWDPKQGGKMPGFGGTYGRAGWGGRPVKGIKGWSSRGLFRGVQDGKTQMGFYCYHADMPGQYGSEWKWEIEKRGLLENNRWYCIEQYCKMNTPGEKDGILRAWVDGKPAFEKTDVRMRNVPELKIENVWINIYHGGKWAAVTEDHLFIDDVVISREYVGPKQGKNAIEGKKNDK